MRTTTTHGYAIIDRKWSERVPGTEIILAHMPDNDVTPFVVWRMDPDTGICEGGDYCTTLARGVLMFRDRA